MRRGYRPLAGIKCFIALTPLKRLRICYRPLAGIKCFGARVQLHAQAEASYRPLAGIKCFRGLRWRGAPRTGLPSPCGDKMHRQRRRRMGKHVLLPSPCGDKMHQQFFLNKTILSPVNLIHLSDILSFPCTIVKISCQIYMPFILIFIKINKIKSANRPFLRSEIALLFAVRTTLPIGCKRNFPNFRQIHNYKIKGRLNCDNTFRIKRIHCNLTSNLRLRCQHHLPHSHLS